MLKYAPYLRKFARNLRNDSTQSEIRLWQHIKAKQLSGLQFNRQYPIGNYILDFYCPKAKLGIELDGSTHFDADVAIKDVHKNEYMNSVGVMVIRYADCDVFEQIDDVLNEILTTANARIYI